MKTLLSALVLTVALTSAAMAGEPATSTGAGQPGPVVLTEAQLDTITAGGGVGGSIDPGGGGSLTLYGGNGAGVGSPIEDAVGGDSDPTMMEGPPQNGG